MPAHTSWVVADYDNGNQASGSLPIVQSVGGDRSLSRALAEVNMPIRVAGTIQNLAVFIGLEQFVSRVACHINGVDSALSIDTSGPTGHYENTTDRVAVVATDDICYNHSVVSGSGTNRFTNAKYEFVPDGSETISFMYGANQDFTFTFQSNSTIERTGINGLTDDDGAVDNRDTQWEVRAAGRWHGCYVYITENSRITDSEVKAGINGAEQSNILVTVTAGMTGVFEDSANDETVAEGDLLNWRWENFTGGGTLRASQVSSYIARALPCWEMSPEQLAGTAQNDGLTYENPPGGGWRGISSGGDFFAVVARSRQTFRRFSTEVTANTLGAATTARVWLRVADSSPGDSPSLIQVSAGMTGQFTSRNQHICEIGDTVTVRRQNIPTSSGAWTLHRFQCLESPEDVQPTELFWDMPRIQVEGGGRR